MTSVRPLSFNVPGADLPSGRPATDILQATSSMVRPRIGGKRRRTRRTRRRNNKRRTSRRARPSV